MGRKERDGVRYEKNNNAWGDREKEKVNEKETAKNTLKINSYVGTERSDA